MKKLLSLMLALVARETVALPALAAWQFRERMILQRFIRKLLLSGVKNAMTIKSRSSSGLEVTKKSGGAVNGDTNGRRRLQAVLKVVAALIAVDSWQFRERTIFQRSIRTLLRSGIGRRMVIRFQSSFCR